MNDSRRPRVSIGLPVYNGARYLAESLSSLVEQTFVDLEIIVCDNASTDSTAEIAKAFARADPRVRYARNRSNIGIARNFNRAFELSRGTYFKWAAHDDVCRPQFVERCVEELDQDPATVLVYPSPLDIDAAGGILGPRDASLDFRGRTPFERFRAQMTTAHAGLHLFGLIRSDVLRRTGLHGEFHGGDRVLLAELALHGPFTELPEQLYLHREHGGRVSHATTSAQEMMRNYDPDGAAGLVFPTWRMLRSYLGAAWRAPVGLQQTARCWIQMLGWCKGKRGALADDLRYNATLAISQLRRLHGSRGR